MTTLLWLRDDLRVHDHPALNAALQDDGVVVALWIRECSPPEPEGEARGPRPLGAASRWWYHQSLVSLSQSLAELGIPLLFAQGDARQILPDLAQRLGAGTVRWTRRYAQPARALDAEVKAGLLAAGLAAHSHPGSLLVEPWTLSTTTGGHYTVFTPFHRRASELDVGACLPAPDTPPQDADSAIALPDDLGEAVTRQVDDLELLDDHPQWWRDTVTQHWSPGEDEALARLDAIEQWLPGYHTSHDLPADYNSTSRLSPHLRTGEVSPRQLLEATNRVDVPAADRQAWLRQLYWREFCWHLTFHLDDLSTRPMRPQFEAFPYEPDEELLRAWQRGRTGYGLVDAGMMQLWQTGWMHNRVRMVTASLLTKNLLQPWWLGEQWFWDTLVDADEASNPVSWQWVAGCGADAAPYFRVFNPELQRLRFDPDGAYATRWLRDARPGSLAPVVDLKQSRQEALEAYEAVRQGR